MQRIFWILLVVFAIIIGLYPSIYFIIDRKFGLLSTKSDEILASGLWNICFYIHIFFGGIALLLGWTQFMKTFRNRYPQRHRKIGKIYILSVLLSSSAGIYIGFFATGGIISSLGFISLGVVWFSVTWMAFSTIKKKKIIEHQKLMIYSYAMCFAAVTLRLWLPLLVVASGNFVTGYIMVAWLCWIPNLIFAKFFIQRTLVTHS